MSVWNRLGQIAKDIGGAVTAPAKFAWDVATAPWNDDEHFNGFANTMASATKNLGTSLVKPISDVAQLPVVSQTLNAINTVNQNLIREPLTTAALAIGDTISGKGNIFDPNEWKKAYTGAQTISFGQAVTGDVRSIYDNNFNIYDPAQREQAFKKSTFGRFASGLADTGIQFAGDVTLGLGKGLKVLKASEYGVGAIRTADQAAAAAEGITKAQAGETNRFSKILDDFTNNDSTYALKHPMVQSSHEPGLIAHLLGESTDKDTTAEILRSALGDPAAMADLSARRADMTQAINLANQQLDAVDKFKMSLKDKFGKDIVNQLWEDPEVVKEAKAALAVAGQQDTYLNKLLTIGAGGGSLTRTTGTTLQGIEDFVAKSRAANFYDKPAGNPIISFYQATPFHRMVQVISHAEHERPAGLVDLNDPNSYKEVVATLERGHKLTDMTEEESKAHLDNFIKQTSPEGRSRAALNMEQGIFAKVAAKRGVSMDQADEIWQEYHAARTSAVKTIKEETFMVDHDKSIIKAPVFESQTADFLPIMDFDLMDRLLKRHGSSIALLGRTKDTMVHYANILQDAFKAAALLRGGYTIRNGVDSQLRIMASVGAMASVRHFGAGMKNMMFNTIPVPQRMVDGFAFQTGKIAKVQDVVAQREAVKTELDSLDSKIAELQKVTPLDADAPRFHANSVVSARVGAKDYASRFGFTPDNTIDYKNITADKERAAKIADEFDKLPAYDEKAIPKYEALAKEVELQYSYMTKKLGINVEFVDKDPYKNSKEMFADVSQGRLKVLKTETTGKHAYFTDEQNNKFRAVHDYFGHAATGRGFAQDGEEAAWVHHSQMFSQDARAALTTETRGQNSWYNTRGKFADQKVAILPKEYHEVTSDIARSTDGHVNAANITELGALKNLREEKQAIYSHHSDTINRLSTKGGKLRMGDGIIEHTTSDGQKYTLYDAFGGPLGQMFRKLNSSATTFQRLVDTNSELLGRKLASKGIGAVKPTDTGYFDEWANTLNTAFANTASIRQLAGGAKPADVANWLKNTPEGQQIRKRLLISYGETDQYVAKINGFLDNYLPAENQVLRDKLARHEAITPKELRAANATKDVEELPVIHGNVLKENINNNSLISVRSVANTAFKFLGSMPEDAWARHPLYRELYRDELNRRLDIAGGMKKERLTPAEQQDVMNRAHDFAQTGVKKILFNIERRTNLATQLKYISPFFSAQENAIKTWLKLGIENPVIINRGNIVWNSPNRSGLVTDQNDKPVPAGKMTSSDTIWLEMPNWTKRIPFFGAGVSALSQQGITKQSLDVIFGGGMNALYGGGTSVPFNDIIPVGPYIAIPASELVKTAPQFEDVLKWALPFGPTKGSAVTGLMPAWLKRAQTLVQGQSSQEYVRTYQLIHTTELHLARDQGKPMPSDAEIKRKTDDYYKMRIAANLILPYSPKFDSPYRLYLDKYRQYQQTYGINADTQYLKDFGPSLFDFATSLSSNKAGATATQATYQATNKYRSLVTSVFQDDPSLVGLITNNPAGGNFSQAVYDWQYNTPVGPGTGETFRSSTNAVDAEKQNQVKLGWIQYRNVMNQIDAVLQKRGLMSVTQKGAEDLKVIKQAVVDTLAYQHDNNGNPVLDKGGQPVVTPWYEAYLDPQGSKTFKVISGLNKIVDPNESFWKDNQNNPTWKSVKTYLQVRTQLSNILSQRKVKTLTAKANADVSALYEAVVGQLKQDDIGFADLYDRYLSQDQVYYKYISDAAANQGA